MLFMSCVLMHLRLFIAALWSADLRLLLVMFNCVFVTFLCGILGKVWYLIVTIPDLCRLSSISVKKILRVKQIIYMRYRMRCVTYRMCVKVSFKRTCYRKSILQVQMLRHPAGLEI